MKFHRVKLKNLNSLYGEQIIDFEEDVRNSPLFLIIGPTGAGKSTILDAICLALFGQTPRLSRKAGRTDLDVAHIMSLGTSSAYAEADFSVLDNEGGRARYLATWSTRRAYDDPEGAVQKPERSLYRKFDDGTMRLVVADHREKYFQPAFDEALHGLSVDDFKRSILLAQGEFSSFLRAPDAEKASILERLTNTDEYRIIGERAARKRRAVDERQRKLTTRLEEMQILTDAQESELEASIEACATSVAQRRAELGTARKKVDWLRRRDELQEHCATAQQSHASILSRREKREDDYRRLHRDGELVEAEPSWSEVRRQDAIHTDLDEKLGPLAGQITELETKATAAATMIEKATAALDRARTELREREPEIRRGYQLRTRREGAQREVENASKDLATRREALQRLESLRKDTLEKLEPARELTTQAAKRLDALKVSRPLLQRLAPLRASYVDGIAPLEARSAELGAEIDATAKRIAAIDSERASFDDAIAEAKRERGKWQGQVTRYKNRLDELTRDWKSLEAAVERLSTDNQSASSRAEALREARFLLQRISESERERDEVFARVEETEREVKALAEEEEQLKELETSRRAYARQCEESLRLNERLIALSSYRRDLHGGEPCPLCGSPIHPYCDSDELEQVDRKAQADRDRLAVELETAREDLRATNEKVQRLAGKFVSRKTALRHDEGRLVAVKQALEKSQAAFADASGRAGYSPLETFQLKNASRVEEELEEAEETAKTSRAKLDEIETARHQLARAEERLEEADLARREVEDKVGALGEEHRQLSERIRTRTADLELVRGDRTRREGAIRTELVELGVEVDDSTAIEVALSRADARLEELVAAGSHAESTSKVVADLEQALQRHEEKLDEAREAVDQAVQAVEARQTSLDELDAAIAACLEGEDPEKVKERLEAAVKTARDALDAETKSRAATAEKLSAARARQTDLTERRERATKALSEAEQNLLAVLDNLGIAREEVEANLLPPEERKKLRAELTALDGELARAATRVHDADQRLARHLESHAGEPPALQELNQAVEIAEACEEQLNQATLGLGGLRERWEKHETTKARRVELEAEIREVQHEVDVWGTLYGLIGVRDGERFKLYAQSLNLQGLVDRANHRLEKLHPRYRLCVQHGEGGEPTLTFGVVDRYQANIERPLTTLSGGETFLVSLALALGLADFRQVDMPVETLLLDEGFGTLDQDSLHMALTTLHQLHYDASRQIGIISHVDALKELIDSRIVVEPVGHGRSQIRFEFGAQKSAPPLVLQR